jgi:hypothetical protein
MALKKKRKRKRKYILLLSADPTYPQAYPHTYPHFLWISTKFS